MVLKVTWIHGAPLRYCAQCVCRKSPDGDPSFWRQEITACRYFVVGRKFHETRISWPEIFPTCTSGPQFAEMNTTKGVVNNYCKGGGEVAAGPPYPLETERHNSNVEFEIK